jgi:hypothetical protein
MANEMRDKMKKIVGVNENGLRVGEDHQNAKLTFHKHDFFRAKKARFDSPV